MLIVKRQAQSRIVAERFKIWSSGGRGGLAVLGVGPRVMFRGDRVSSKRWQGGSRAWDVGEMECSSKQWLKFMGVSRCLQQLRIGECRPTHHKEWMRRILRNELECLGILNHSEPIEASYWRSDFQGLLHPGWDKARMDNPYILKPVVAGKKP